MGGTAGGGGAGGLAGSAGLGGSSGTAPKALGLMTWNLETFPKAQQTPSAVAQIIKDRKPDLIAVQEISDAQAFEALPQALDDYAAIAANDPNNFLRVGYLYKKASLSLGEVQLLFEKDSYAFPRPVLKARVLVKGTSRDFVVLNVHLKAKLDSASQQRRRAACEKLEAWIAGELQAGAETEFVVLGDFNDKLNDPAQYNVFLPWLNKATEYKFLTNDAVLAGDHTYIPFKSMIDHLLVTQDANRWVAPGTTEVLKLEQEIASYESLISDHRPVVARFVVE